MHQAVSATKMALSGADEAEFRFPALGKAGEKTVRRQDFESWIESDLASITGALDDVLEKTGTDAGSVDKIFLTGGTSFVPTVRRIFTERFAADRIETGGELISIAHGLALIGERDDIEQWTVPVAA